MPHPSHEPPITNTKLVLPSVEELMDILATMTGWSDQSHAVEVGFKSAPRYDSGGDRDGYDNTRRGFVVKTTLCGETDHSGRSAAVHAEGKTLPEALMALAREVDRALGIISCRTTERSQKAHRAWLAFLEPHQ